MASILDSVFISASYCSPLSAQAYHRTSALIDSLVQLQTRVNFLIPTPPYFFYFFRVIRNLHNCQLKCAAHLFTVSHRI